ncbi:MAG: helix-turn-helix domain-containing protein [Chitinophagales bacterium]|nr:helix-turn-helix domain-containing protein [Chitinophagales bacterium]
MIWQSTFSPRKLNIFSFYKELLQFFISDNVVVQSKRCIIKKNELFNELITAYMHSYNIYHLHPILRRYIDCIWVDQFFDQAANKNKPHLIIPDKTVEVIFTQDTVHRELKSGGDIQKNKTHLSGLKTKPQKIRLNSSPIICIRFKAHGLYTFTKVKASEVVDRAIAPLDIFGKSFEQFEEQLFEANNITEQIALVEHYFFEKLKEFDFRQDYSFEAILHKLELSKGIRSIQSLAEEFNVSIKTIERKFSHHLGVSPKKYSRILRLFHALQTQSFKPDSKLVEIAYECGFYDQMHFIKEVKHFTGMPPTDYLQSDRVFQQPIFTSLAN